VHAICVHTTEDAADKNSASFDESSKSFSIWHIVPILEVSYLLLGNEEVWG